MTNRVLSLRRQVLKPRTVLEPRFLDMMLGIGYVNVAGFQEYTPQELDQALAKLEEGFRQRSPAMMRLIDPLFDPLRNEPRFKQLWADTKLPP